MLKDFFNRLYENNVEAQEIIGAIQPEIDVRAAMICRIYKNCFAATADLDGIRQWENALNILADQTIETMQFRRERVIIRLSNMTPYTERTLHRLMDAIIGAGNWAYELNPVACTLGITCLRPGRAWMREMSIILGDILPANIELALYLTFNTWDAVRDFTWGRIKTKKWRETKEEVL